jgi:hypothetical protein
MRFALRGMVSSAVPKTNFTMIRPVTGFLTKFLKRESANAVKQTGQFDEFDKEVNIYSVQSYTSDLSSSLGMDISHTSIGFCDNLGFYMYMCNLKYLKTIKNKKK